MIFSILSFCTFGIGSMKLLSRCWAGGSSKQLWRIQTFCTLQIFISERKLSYLGAEIIRKFRLITAQKTFFIVTVHRSICNNYLQATLPCTVIHIHSNSFFNIIPPGRDLCNDVVPFTTEPGFWLWRQLIDRFLPYVFVDNLQMEEMADLFDSVWSVQSTSNINRTKFIVLKYKIIYGVIQFFSVSWEPLEMTDEEKSPSYIMWSQSDSVLW